MKSSASIVFAVMSFASLPAAPVQITDLSRLEFDNAVPGKTIYKGSPSLKMIEKDGHGPSGEGAFATVKGLEFRDGVIDVDVAGMPKKDATPTARGFIGVAFRIQPDGQRFEMIYLRPTNGRSDDQEMRNHTVQYVAGPEWGWKRLRAETPSKYESYADMQPAVWTHMRIVVRGKTASLYVGNAKQPCLIVRDMKNGESAGALALWIGPETEGYFRNLQVRTAPGS